MEKCDVFFFEVGAECLNIIKMYSSFKGLKTRIYTSVQTTFFTAEVCADITLLRHNLLLIVDSPCFGNG
jgi:hypothetical protein